MKILILLVLAFNICAQETYPTFTIIKTGEAKSLEALIYEEGSLLKTMKVNHSGFLINYQGKNILLETGLGDNIDKQFSTDMPLWAQGHYLPTIKVHQSERNLQENTLLIRFSLPTLIGIMQVV